MERKKLFIVSVLIVVAVFSSALLLDQLQKETGQGSVETLANSSEVMTTEDGTRYTVHPDKLMQGCPGMDCIPSIEDPEFEDGNPEWLEEDDRVIGLEVDGDARAYPLKILRLHEIVNDRIKGEPVAVTYCPLCRSGVTYSREVDGETLEFGVSGKLLDANLVMYDRSSESYWNQISGKAIVGPRAGQELELKFSSITRWGDWKKGHPDTKVLSRDTGIYPVSSYERSAYAGYYERESVGFGVEDVDDRLTSKELVRGVKIGNESKAYPEKAVREQKIIHDRLGGEPLLIIERPDDGTITGYVRESNGRKLNFTLEENGLRDSGGRLWSFEGKQVDGEGGMDRVAPQGFYWFAWSKFHPETKLYKP